VTTVRRGKTTRQVVTLPVHGPAQDLADRIWAGQSPDLAVIERVERIANAVKARGWPVDAITLPHPDAGRYLEAH